MSLEGLQYEAPDEPHDWVALDEKGEILGRHRELSVLIREVVLKSKGNHITYTHNWPEKNGLTVSSEAELPSPSKQGYGREA